MAILSTPPAGTGAGRDTPSKRAAASTPKLNRAALERDLRAAVRGEVRFDDGSRAVYATDASNYRQPPIGVVIPRDRDDVIAAVRVCHRHGAPVLSRGGGTSLAGQCCNVAVVLDFTKYCNRILEIDPERRIARVEPGVVLDALQKAAAAHGLVFGPDPATHLNCTFGGMIGNNSCGIRSVMASLHGNGPRASDNLDELVVLTYDGTILRVGATSDGELERLIGEGGRAGEIYAGLKRIRETYGDQVRTRFPKIPRRVSGYNLDDLLPEKGCNVARALAGSEGTCAVILEATVRLLPKPKATALLVLGYRDVYEAGDHIPDILRLNPIGLEGMDDRLVQFLRDRGLYLDTVDMLPKGKGWLLVEFGGDSVEACVAQAERAKQALGEQDQPPEMKIHDDPEEIERLWDVRESGLGATAFVKGMADTWEGWEDTAVPPERVGAYLRDFRDLLERYDYDTALYGHFGQGCIHCRINFDLVTAQGLKTFRSFLEEVSDLVLRHGGSFSGEHGDGQSRAELLPKMFGPELVEAFREFKRVWDPQGRMNPGKVVDPAPILSNLRLGTGYNPARPKTYFQYAEDDGDFSRAVLRCVGVGKCRREEGGTMCPSYMVTHEEKHTTRGRARLLFEMLQGNVIQDGFRSEAVKDALDLCLSCKGCKGDCPVNVDLATYKAEFLAHYYQGRARPLHAYAFGLIARWARLGSRFPRLTNFVQRAPFFSDVLKAVVGIAPERQLPRFAPATFKDWFFRGPRPNRHGPPVILWPDTFNNYYQPQVARAATLFLERAGWKVIVPRAALCCGRPLYDYGMLDTARTWLERIVADLRDSIRAGIPVVGLEPSCVATFRDELVNLLPHDDDARRLARQTLLLSEFIDRKLPDLPLPQLPRRAIVHGHCHHKAVMKMNAEERVLQRMGLDCEFLDAGCCGMAGAFGFEKEHYGVSMACGERVLLPAARAADPETLVVANGFSCREQIAQATPRRAMHLAEVLDFAHRLEVALPMGENARPAKEPRDPTKAEALLAIGAGVAAVGGAVWWFARRRRTRLPSAPRPTAVPAPRKP
jgi:FAD/FMN-containing dehydrogenase/Fe-S oxidoreductase